MKVIEEGTDRSAEMHFYIEGSVNPLSEYGEYIAADYAICCYVPVEEGNKPQIRGTFKGTTKDIACDAFVDGVHRRSFTYTAKDVQHIKKKIEIDSFLFMSENGAINSGMLVAPLNELTTAKKSELDSRETVGTIELRLYVTRQLDVSHEIKDTMYDSPKTDDAVQYNRIPPTFQLNIEGNSAPITKRTESAFRRRMTGSRPGREPWAVFRFHYRGEDALYEPDLPVTFDVNNKKLIEPRILPLEPVPPLVVDSEIKRSAKIGPHTPSPFPTGTWARVESVSSKSSTPIHDITTIKPTLAMKTMTSASRGIEFLQNRIFETPSEMVMESPYLAGAEGLNSPTSVPAIREPTAATEAPLDEKNSEQDPAPADALPSKRSLPTMEQVLPGPKRPKPLPIPTAPSAEPLTPHSTSVSDTSEMVSSENRFSEYKKKLANLRKTWLEKDKELAAIKKEIENCKCCMNEELDRMRRELLEEEDAFTEETKHCGNNNNVENDGNASMK